MYMKLLFTIILFNELAEGFLIPLNLSEKVLQPIVGT